MSKFLLISNDINVHHFDCGNAELNTFLKQRALLNQERKLGGTTLLIDDEKLPPSILGFYTLCPCHVVKEVLPKKFGGDLPQEIPAIKLARLAVDKHHQKQGLGGVLLAHALRCSYQQSVVLGGYVILIDVKPNAQRFYEKYGMRMIQNSADKILMGIRTKDVPSHFPECWSNTNRKDLSQK